MKKPLAILVLLLAALLIYAPALKNDFVWDDTALVQRDPLIRSWRLIPEGFNHFLFVDATASDFYRPIQRLSYTLDYAFAGFSPALYHLTSILVHAAAAIALYLLALETLAAFDIFEKRGRWIGIFAALVWLIHPAQTSAVVYISGRADPLAGLFGFLGCYLILQASRAARVNLLCLTGGALAFLLSALSKESGLIFPLLAITLLVILKRWRAVWQTATAAVFVVALYASLRFAAVHHAAPVLHPPEPLATRPITMARAVAEYAGIIALPVNLHMERQLSAKPSEVAQQTMARYGRRELQTLLGLGLVAAGIWGAFRLRKTEPAAFTFLTLAGLSYLPVSGLIGLNAAVAEHWLYLPTAFLFLAAATLLAQRLQGMRPLLPLTCGALLACWVAFLGARTCLRTFDWKDQRTFLEATIAAGGDSARMLTNLAGLESSEGKLDLAREHLEGALKQEPNQPIATMNLAVVALRQNNLVAARQLAEKAKEMPIVDAQAQELLAVLTHREKGTLDVLRFRLAARTGPPNWAIEKRYVQAIAQTGAVNAAVLELQTCLQREWYRAESWQLLEQLLTKLGRNQEAGWAREQALAYDVHLPVSAKLL